ncbi:MAG: hypothetical protein H7837_03520 [Magnetococcus sp. MYC-9]
MLPLLSWMTAGALTVLAVRRSRRRRLSAAGGASRPLPPGTFQVIEQKVVAATEQILATEELPLDNRFGNQPFVSEHEFHRSAAVSMETEWRDHWDGAASAELLHLLKAELQGRLAHTLGVEAGMQISRQVRLKFTVAPGKRVLYRVVWKQTAQRGLFQVGVGRQVHSVPYLVTYGLSHAVHSMAMEEEGA